MSTGIAGAPQADPVGVDFGTRFQIGDGAPPVLDLPPGVDVLARGAVAGTEGAVVVDQSDETGLGERGGEAEERHFLHRAVPMGHSDRRVPAGSVGNVQHPAQDTPSGAANSMSR
ncbi:hypothetical protein GCM10017744_003760 [Streptomyces antimycoticus]|uniref:Uncharacterized protein n=1 Tax=Streptomyces antimycoticus TaxID=68175 RepID=A0A4D4KP80_9ACTN|nr:hypothetical protein SANT12839_095880 [Streptomyces antimycoticus]